MPGQVTTNKTTDISEAGERERIFNRLQRMMISIQDFQVAVSTAVFLLEEVDEQERYALPELRRFRCFETTMVVSYARPFSMAKGLVNPLRKTDIGLTKKDPFNKLHERIIKDRNTLFSHSDAEYVEMRVLSMRPFKDRSDVTITMPRFDEGMRFTYDEGVLVRDIQKIGPDYRERFRQFDDE